MTNNSIAVVVDSAAGLPADLAQKLGIHIIEIGVHFKSETSSSFWDNLRASSSPPTTSAPSAAAFAQCYSQLAESGAQRIVSVHVSGEMSTTFSAARAAAETSPVPVDVVDTRTVSAAQGLVAIAAAEAATKGDDALQAAQHATSNVTIWAMVETLDYLRKGGRIGGAQALLGSMLKIRPIIAVRDGIVTPEARVRTREKAFEYFAQLVTNTPHERCVVVGDDSPDIAKLTEMMPSPPFATFDAGPVVGTHTGPGTAGVALLRTS